MQIDLFSVKSIKELLEKYHAKPLKGLGQNFLVHQLTIAKIIEAAKLNSTDTVLEIGPGIGTLTQALAQKAKKIIAIEKDGGMVEILKETLQGCENIEVIQGDALKITPPNIPYKVVANLPYYITSPVIRMFLESENPPTQMIFMVQKEVAQRICAKPPHMSILAVSVQFYATAKIVASVSKEKFWPSPNVDSAVIEIVPFNREEKISSEKFFQVVKAGFSHPRKQLANNFSVTFKKDREKIGQWLAKNNIKPEQRAETLTIAQWIDLTKSY